MSQVGIRRVGDMQDVEPGIIFFGQIDGVEKGDVGVFGEIGAKKDILVFYHGDLLFLILPWYHFFRDLHTLAYGFFKVDRPDAKVIFL